MSHNSSSRERCSTGPHTRKFLAQKRVVGGTRFCACFILLVIAPITTGLRRPETESVSRVCRAGLRLKDGRESVRGPTRTVWRARNLLKERRVAVALRVLRDYIVTLPAGPHAARPRRRRPTNLKRFADNRRVSIVPTREAQIGKRGTIRSKKNSHRDCVQLRGISLYLRPLESARL